MFRACLSKARPWRRFLIKFLIKFLMNPVCPIPKSRKRHGKYILHHCAPFFFSNGGRFFQIIFMSLVVRGLNSRFFGGCSSCLRRRRKTEFFRLFGIRKNLNFWTVIQKYHVFFGVCSKKFVFLSAGRIRWRDFPAVADFPVLAQFGKISYLCSRPAFGEKWCNLLPFSILIRKIK